MKRFALLLSLLCATLAYSQETVTIESEPASLVTLESEFGGRWIPGSIFSGDDSFAVKPLNNGKTAVLASGLPGTTRKVLLIPSDDKKPYVAYAVTAKGEKVEPTPGPDDEHRDDDNKPEPQPKPTTEKLRLVVVERSESRTPKQAADYLAPELRAYAESKGHVVSIWDDDAKPSGENAAEYRALLDRAVGKSLPYVIVLGMESGTIYSEGSLPASGCLNLLKAWEAK